MKRRRYISIRLFLLFTERESWAIYLSPLRDFSERA